MAGNWLHPVCFAIAVCLLNTTLCGAIVIEYDITPDDMSIYQPHQMHKKYAAFDRHQGLGDVDRIIPRTARLRIEELASELPEATRRIQREGASTRVRTGKATEPTPRR